MQGYAQWDGLKLLDLELNGRRKGSFTERMAGDPHDHVKERGRHTTMQDLCRILPPGLNRVSVMRRPTGFIPVNQR